jgi:hypothetical protein
MDWLEPPWQFFRIEPEHPITIPVVRYQVGMAQRPIADPPGVQQLLTIRFHLPGAAGWGLQPYVDFGNRILIQKVLSVYGDVIAVYRRAVPFRSLELAKKIVPEDPEALVLRLTRHGERIDTWYDVDVVWEQA